MKHRTKLLTITTALALAVLAGCGSSGGSDAKADESKSDNWSASAKTESAEADDGFGTYSVEDAASGATITVEISKKLDYTDQTSRAVDKFVNDYAITPELMDANWAKATVDNTDGHSPLYPEVLMTIITGDGEKVEATMAPVTQVEMQVYDSFGDTANEALMDDMSELPGGMEENDPGIYPGTKETLPLMILGDVKSVKSVWLTDVQMERVE